MFSNLVLRFQGKELGCLGGRFGLSLKTEGWDAAANAWVYGQDVHLLASLQITVDEESGEDGAASPDASWRFSPGPVLLSGMWDDSAPEMEAWFGNDASALTDNCVELRGVGCDGLLQIRWTASLEESGERMELEGGVQFLGLTCNTPQPLDAARLLGEVWPDARDWPSVASEPVDYGDKWASHRRYWSEVRWEIPGTASAKGVVTH